MYGKYSSQGNHNIYTTDTVYKAIYNIHIYIPNITQVNTKRTYTIYNTQVRIQHVYSSCSALVNVQHTVHTYTTYCTVHESI